MSAWVEQFKPVSDIGWSVRPGQERLGNAIIDTLNQQGILVGQAECGTGKSLASLIPIINIIKSRRESKGTPYRAVVSTETITLQNQLNDKDLPFLSKLYGGFTYKKLLGRSNYFCLSRAATNASDNPSLIPVLDALEAALPRLLTGERGEVESVTGRLSEDDWAALVSDGEYCVNNKCSDDDYCFAAKARMEALQSDIVIINHKILAIDSDMKLGVSSENVADGMVGQVDAIIVDEAHKLEDALSDSFSIKYSIWEINAKATALFTGLQVTNSLIKKCESHIEDFGNLRKQLSDFFELTTEFFKSIESDNDSPWEGSESTFSMRFVHPSKTRSTRLMEKYEAMGPSLFLAVKNKLDEINKFLMPVISELGQPNIKRVTTGKDRKAIRSARSALVYLYEMADIFDKSMNSKNGIISHMGMTYGSLVHGWVRNDGTPGMTIRVVPIDISTRASNIWNSVNSTIFLSATLEDLTSNDFRYFKRSLGIKDCREIKVESPFTMDRQQLVYITDKKYEAEDSTVFSVREIVESVNATSGRSLILFTSRRDLNMAVEQLNMYKVSGSFPYTMLIQTPDSDKGALVEAFKNDDTSVLLGLKSMFTGIDIPGERLSNVIICRFPLPRFSVECKMRINYWKSCGFPNWYEREALTVFQQAAGRLIRSTECIGVVSILDQRVFDPTTSVFNTAKTGVTSLKSRTTHSFSDVMAHLEGVSG